MEHKFIIIDDGDRLLESKELSKYINMDFKNQYLIFSRGNINIFTAPENRGELIKKELTVKYFDL